MSGYVPCREPTLRDKWLDGPDSYKNLVSNKPIGPSRWYDKVPVGRLFWTMRGVRELKDFLSIPAGDRPVVMRGAKEWLISERGHTGYYTRVLIRYLKWANPDLSTRSKFMDFRAWLLSRHPEMWRFAKFPIEIQKKIDAEADKLAEKLTREAIRKAERGEETALYRMYDADGNLLYIGISYAPFARVKQHARDKGWAKSITTIKIEWWPDRVDAEHAELAAIAAEKPIYNVIGQPKTDGNRPKQSEILAP